MFDTNHAFSWKGLRTMCWPCLDSTHGLELGWTHHCRFVLNASNIGVVLYSNSSMETLLSNVICDCVA
jgi:hypothetical protein